jgi:hypothetical protein
MTGSSFHHQTEQSHVVNFIMLYVVLIRSSQQAVKQQNNFFDAVLGSIVQVHFNQVFMSQWHRLLPGHVL